MITGKEGREVRFPIRPDLIFQVISQPYSARMSSVEMRCRMSMIDKLTVRLTSDESVDRFRVDEETYSHH